MCLSDPATHVRSNHKGQMPLRRLCPRFGLSISIVVLVGFSLRRWPLAGLRGCRALRYRAAFDVLVAFFECTAQPCEATAPRVTEAAKTCDFFVSLVTLGRVSSGSK